MRDFDYMKREVDPSFEERYLKARQRVLAERKKQYEAAKRAKKAAEKEEVNG